MFGKYTKAIVTAATYLIGIILFGYLTGEWDRDQIFIGAMGLVNVLGVALMANAYTGRHSAEYRRRRRYEQGAYQAPDPNPRYSSRRRQRRPDNY